MKKTKSVRKGAARMMELGKKPVQLWLTQRQHEILTAASIRDRRPLTQFILVHILRYVAQNPSTES